MTLLAYPDQQIQEMPCCIHILVSEPHFFQAFKQSYSIAEFQYLGQPITDDTLYGAIRRVMAQPALTLHWKAGAITGWFAALYHIPCRFDTATIPPVPQTPRLRPIELCYNDPLFPSAYEVGYQAFRDVVSNQPITDDDLYAELVHHYLPTLAHPRLRNARWCAGYVAGLMAALFRIPCFAQNRDIAHSPPTGK